jgi:hypothetical protein
VKPPFGECNEPRRGLSLSQQRIHPLISDLGISVIARPPPCCVPHGPRSVPIVPARSRRARAVLLVTGRSRGWKRRGEIAVAAGAEENYVRLHAGAGSYLVRGTLVGREARLDPVRFIRVHRSPASASCTRGATATG